MAICLLLSGRSSVQNHSNGICEEILGPHLFPPTERSVKENCKEQVDGDSALSMPHKLIRSVSSKLKKWRQRLEADGEENGIQSMNEQPGESETRPGEETTGVVEGRAVETQEESDKEPQENDRWTRIGCFGSKGRTARFAYVGRDEATEVVPTGLNENTGAENVRYQDGAVREGRRRPLGRDLDFLDGIDYRREKNRRPLQEIGQANPAQVEAAQLRDEWHSGRQCGCFVNGRIERLKDWGTTRGERCGRESLHEEESHPGLPDDVVEMCLARTPFSTLMRARLVCKKWRALTLSPHFLQTRERVASKKPWLLLFGLSRDGVCTGQIHALDPTFDKWHSIRADMLSGRFLYSVASVNGAVYVIGGCSSSPSRHGRSDKSSMKTHKAVLLYNPVTSSWKKVCSMGAARAMAVVGVFEMREGRIVRGTSGRGFSSCRYDGLDPHGERMESATGRGTVFENSEDSTRSSSARGWPTSGKVGEISDDGETLGRQEAWESSGGLERDSKAADINQALFSSRRFPGIGLEMDWERGLGWERSVKEEARSYGLIVVGGQGVWNEPLYSAEVYDTATNRWREVAKLPADHGVTCAGVACNGLFYVYSETDKLAAYDFEQNLWTSIQVSNIPSRLHEYIPKLVSCKGRLFLLGVAWGEREREVGNGVEKATRMLWECSPSSQAWLQVSKHPDAPLDWNAVFVSEGDQIFGVEMFKIFGQVLDFVTVCDLSGSEVKWERVSRMRLANDMDVSSCITKTAVVVQL